MQMDVAAWAASVIIGPHVKRRQTAQKLLGRKFIIEEDQRAEKRTNKADHLKRKMDLDRRARELSKRKSNG